MAETGKGRTEEEQFVADMAEAQSCVDDGWCVECGEAFHLDDCGGYNPPRSCCGLCRDCCECDKQLEDEEYGDDGFDA